MRWLLKPKPDTTQVKLLAEQLNITGSLAYLLVQRGICTFKDAEVFFRPSLTHLHNPFLMKDMDLAVQRIEKAIESGENIMVFGDYDVDGTTSVSLVSSYLKTLTDQIATYIPDRYEEGYGVSYQGIDYADDNGFSLIIALDCGIKAVDKVAYARTKGIDFIICDHHTPGVKIPEAVAILNPKQIDCSYPYKELCGCGVGFKLVQALASKRGQQVEDLMSYLDLTAVAIGADIVPMTGENRTLMYFGLQILNQKPRIGFNTLLRQLKKKVYDVNEVVFVLAPRINAAGRMKHGQHAVALLTETDESKAEVLGQEIETFNLDRRQTDQDITREALQLIETSGEQKCFSTVVYQEHWHKGVIGIVASRLTETYYRPTVVFTKSGDKLAASARSVSGFDLYRALENCTDYLEQFGGHKFAAGLTLKESQYESFKSQFEKVVSESIEEWQKTPTINIDMELSLQEIDAKFYRILKQLSPFGPENMNPVFVARGVRDSGYGKTVGKAQDHLRLSLTQGSSSPIVAIGFGLGNKLDIIKSGKPFDAVFSIDENEWNGQVSLQLKLHDLQEAAF
ncbi:MAG: single-stranded-DNA-specific exonuclease RecJ [Flavobacteriales bacterium CG_4_9_14_3_um_filter_40_17]|nr:MAG: single-stranded-DNA-specific exonuclease RecJ [Flavobacteriales bacterium CG_4_9_14_3_um_filter_40_17]